MLLELTLAAVAAIVSPVPACAAADDSPAAVDDSGEAVTLQTRDKLELSGTYYAPRTKRGLAPAALLVHDTGADREQMRGLALYLSRKGFGVLAIDVRGHGASASKDQSWETADAKARQTLWALASRDLRAAADFLRERPEIHASNLTVVGYGGGCSLATRHALDDENARAVVLIDPQPETLGFNTVVGLSDLAGLPALLVVGKDGRETATRMEQAAEKANDGYHYVTVSVLRAAESELLADRQLDKTVFVWMQDNVLPKK